MSDGDKTTSVDGAAVRDPNPKPDIVGMVDPEKTIPGGAEPDAESFGDGSCASDKSNNLNSADFFEEGNVEKKGSILRASGDTDDIAVGALTSNTWKGMTEDHKNSRHLHDPSLTKIEDICEPMQVLPDNVIDDVDAENPCNIRHENDATSESADKPVGKQFNHLDMTFEGSSLDGYMSSNETLGGDTSHCTRNRKRGGILIVGCISFLLLLSLVTGLSAGLTVQKISKHVEIAITPALSGQPSNLPSSLPILTPPVPPSTQPSQLPTQHPSEHPSSHPSNIPSIVPSNLPSLEPSLTPSQTPSFPPSNKPSLKPSLTPSTAPSANPSSYPSHKPSSKPSSRPTSRPTKRPSNRPSRSPTPRPTAKRPTRPPTKSPTTPFTFGESFVTIQQLNIKISYGLSVKVLARAGSAVQFANGSKSNRNWHSKMDGAGVIPLANGGYVYMSNSEVADGNGGVFGLYFDKNGNVVDYKKLLSGTSKNCSGGVTPWRTYISCEEINTGQCWQIDPDPSSENYSKPKKTALGGSDGGKFESVAVGNKKSNRPVFFVTEDDQFGAIRRFQANGNGWDSLHSSGTTTFLRIIDNKSFEWTSNESAGRESANKYFQNSEGIAYHDGKLYFTAKMQKLFFILDLENMTYTSEHTGSGSNLFSGKGSFSAQPDQIMLGTNRKNIYFCEDGGDSPGVYVRNRRGSYSSVFESIPGGQYVNDETVGIALSPDGTVLFAGMQDQGILMQFTRNDGLPFD